MADKTTESWLVSGCGVSMLCHDKQSVVKWAIYMIDHGGYPEVKKGVPDDRVPDGNK